MTLLMMMISISILVIILMTINMLIFHKNFNIKEKSTPFECGFNSMNKTRIPFSIQFYFICVLFLMFDIEISLILPMIQKIYYINMYKWFFNMFIILTIILSSTFYEWKMNLIKWNN